MNARRPAATAPPASAGTGGPTDPAPGTGADAERAPSPTSDEALAAFRDLAKAGAGAYGRHAALADKFRPLGQEGVALLAELLRDVRSAENRFLAAAVLEALADPGSIPALDAAVDDADVLVSRMASHALAFMGSRDAIPSLERALGDAADWGARVNAAYGLAKLGERSGRDFLIESYRGGGMPALVVIGPMAEIGATEFSAELRPLIGNAGAEIGFRLAAISCAAKAGDRDALPALEAAIASTDAPESLKEAAKRAVNEIRGEEVYPVD